MIAGAVFDIDGTLVDNIAFHFEAFRAQAARLGLVMDEATFQTFNGLKNADIFPRFLGRPLTPMIAILRGRFEALAPGVDRSRGPRARGLLDGPVPRMREVD